MEEAISGHLECFIFFCRFYTMRQWNVFGAIYITATPASFSVKVELLFTHLTMLPTAKKWIFFIYHGFEEDISNKIWRKEEKKIVNAKLLDTFVGKHFQLEKCGKILWMQWSDYKVLIFPELMNVRWEQDQKKPFSGNHRFLSQAVSVKEPNCFKAGLEDLLINVLTARPILIDDREVLTDVVSRRSRFSQCSMLNIARLGLISYIWSCLRPCCYFRYIGFI